MNSLGGFHEIRIHGTLPVGRGPTPPCGHGSAKAPFATSVVRQTMEIPDKGIPRDLLNKARCVIIIPGQKKGGFVVGVKRGFAVCRDQANNGWGAPAAVTVDGGRFGLQIGAENADVVMLVMSQRGMDRLREDKLTLGGDIAAAVGPVGNLDERDQAAGGCEYPGRSAGQVLPARGSEYAANDTGAGCNQGGAAIRRIVRRIHRRSTP